MTDAPVPVRLLQDAAWAIRRLYAAEHAYICGDDDRLHSVMATIDPAELKTLEAQLEAIVAAYQLPVGDTA